MRGYRRSLVLRLYSPTIGAATAKEPQNGMRRKDCSHGLVLESGGVSS